MLHHRGRGLVSAEDLRVCAREVLEVHKGLGRRREVASESQKLLERQAETALASDVLSVGKTAKHPALKLYKRSVGALDPERSSNVDWLQCLDRMLLHSIGWGFGQYIPKRRPLPLSTGQVRHRKAQVDGTGDSSRLYFESSDGTKVFEISRLKDGAGAEVYPCLHVCIDEGPTGFPGMIYLASRGRMSVTCDHFHRMHNDWLLGVGHSGLVAIRNAFKAVGKMRRAPWGSEGHHAELLATAEQYFATHTSGHPHFQWLLEELGAETGCLPVSRAMIADDEANMFAAIKLDLCREPLGAELKSSRWFNYESVARHCMRRRWRTVLLLLQLGVRRKWWSNLGCPLVSAAVAPADDGLQRDEKGLRLVDPPL
eukprot:6460802-Amphidinium_carterae.2